MTLHEIGCTPTIGVRWAEGVSVADHELFELTDVALQSGVSLPAWTATRRTVS